MWETGVEPSGNGGERSVYGADGTLTEVRQISCLNGEAGFLLTDPDTGVSIASKPSTGSCRLLSSDGNLLSGPDLPAGFYEPVECANGLFVLNESGQKTVLVHSDGQVRTLFAKGTSDVLNGLYAAGRTGDHLCFLPLDESGWLFVPVAGADERFVSANQAGFLTTEANGNGTVVRLYRMTNLTVLEKTIPEEVAAAGLTDDGRVALVLLKEDGSGYAYRMLETEDWQERTVYTENDLSAVLGSVSLPEIGNRDEADRFAKEILEKYNVRFLYEPCDLIEELVAAGLASDLSEDRTDCPTL